jgi:PmbA protein
MVSSSSSERCQIESLVSQAIQAGATAADAIFLSSTDVSTGCRFGKIEELERAESSCFGLRVLVGKRQAMVSSSDLAPESCEAAIERAVAIAKQTPEDPFISLAEPSLLATTIPDLQLEDSCEPSAEWLLEQCLATEEAARAVQGISNSEGASASFARHRVILVTSGGFAQEYSQTSLSLSVSVLAGEGTAMERDHDYALVRFQKDLPAPESLGQSAAAKALARLNPKRVQTCAVPVVFDPRVGRGLLGSFASAISGAAIARGTSFLKDSLHQAVFAPSVRIMDNPLVRGGLASKPFDGEGVAGKELALVENGILQHWLLDCRSAAQLGMVTNGRASRSVASAPSPSASNLWIENGNLSVEALIGEIEQGLYVTETSGMGINLLTGDYSQGAAGFWIEKGKKTFPVSEITIAGRLQDMFAQLTPANDLAFKYRVNTPTLRVDKMTVAGNR